MRVRTFTNIIWTLLLVGILFFSAGLYFGWSRVDAASCEVYYQEAAIEADIQSAIGDMGAANEQADPILFDMKLSDVQYLVQQAVDLYSGLTVSPEQAAWQYYIYMRYVTLEDALIGMREGRDITALALATSYYEMLADEFAGTQANCQED